MYGLVTAAVGVGALFGNPLASNRHSGGWLTVYCGAWALQGAATACMGLVLDLPALLLLALLAGTVTPATSITLCAHLAAFAPAERLRLMSVDQTIIRTGGTAGMLVLPLLVDASPRGAFVAGGVMVTGTALGTLPAASRFGGGMRLCRPSRQRADERRGALASASDGEAVGMAYGYPLGPQTDWWDQLAVPISDDMRREDGPRMFGLMELAVRAAWRRQGIARRLHDALLDGFKKHRQRQVQGASRGARHMSTPAACSRRTTASGSTRHG
ncbi:GNAT family N-acetyltransferase [Streptomyces sp. NPDC101206]|uniref:GNAT family N-acetyltransferase n=1 Tax=Streptomyces sp. NPDC101206 TaxID=3366128 RepID=UPI0038090B77